MPVAGNPEYGILGYSLFFDTGFGIGTRDPANPTATFTCTSVGWAMGFSSGTALVWAASEPTAAAATATAGPTVYEKTLNGGASTGSTAAGQGGDFHLSAGDGGAAAGSGNGGNGGNLYLNPGAGGTSGTGAPGGGGLVVVEGTAPAPVVELLAHAAMADADATLTIAQHRGTIISVAAGATNRTITTRTAAQLVAGLRGVQVGSMLPLHVSNLKAANTVTISPGSGVTAPSGTNLVVAAQAAASFALLFTNVTSGAEAVSIIRIAG